MLPLFTARRRISRTRRDYTTFAECTCEATRPLPRRALRLEAINFPGLPCSLAQAQPASVRDLPILRYHYCDGRWPASKEEQAGPARRGRDAPGRVVDTSKALADGVRDGLVDGDVGLDLQPE